MMEHNSFFVPTALRSPDTLTGYRQLSATPALRPVLTTALTVFGVAVAFAVVRGHRENDWTWFAAVALAGLFIARGLHLRRPITLPHLVASVSLLAVADLAYRSHHPAGGFVLLAAAGWALVLPHSTHAQPEMRLRVAALIARTGSDPLAPFALHSSKSYFFDADSTSAIAYRARFGMAVVSGDPIGDRARFPELIAEFSQFARAQGWRLAVLGAGVEMAETWAKVASEHKGLHAIPIGRDVVIDVDSFEMVGRRFRNLRQACSRTRNFGVTTEVIDEAALTDPLREELFAIVDEWHQGRQTRGFSMILDHLLDGRHPGMLLIIARDSQGRPAGFQRYGRSSGGTELSLDVPWRRKDAPNGLDERMIVDLVDYAREQDIHRISLAFAAFPELFDDKNRSGWRKLAYHAVHLGDPLIRLESLYRFLRKFNSLADQRYVMVRFRDIPMAAAAMLTLEFVPHRSH